MEKTVNLLRVPDIWFEIGKYLKFIDLVRIRQTCKDLYQTVKIYWLPRDLPFEVNKRILDSYPDLIIFVECQTGGKHIYIREDIAKLLGFTVSGDNQVFVKIETDIISENQRKKINQFVRKEYIYPKKLEMLSAIPYEFYQFYEHYEPIVYIAEGIIASGYPQPRFISEELVDFLEIPYQYRLFRFTRTRITNYIRKYIKDNNLQGSRKRIIPDGKLQKLLNISKDDVLTYFNIQWYLKVHLENVH